MGSSVGWQSPVITNHALPRTFALPAPLVSSQRANGATHWGRTPQTPQDALAGFGVMAYVEGSMGTKQMQTSSVPSSEDPSIARSMNAIRSVVRALRLNTRAIELQMGISLAQLFVLQQLAERPADSLNELAERTATHQSSVSVVVRRLVERGYVSRTASPTDKRRIEIDVTAAGRALLADAPVTVQQQMIAGLAGMSASERTMLADLLETWLHTSKIDLATPPMLGEEEGELKIAGA